VAASDSNFSNEIMRIPGIKKPLPVNGRGVSGNSMIQ